MRVLLVEDEISHCREYEKCAECLPYAVDLDVAHGMQEAVKLTVDGFYDVVLLDLEFNAGEGDGVSYLEWLRFTELDYDKPFVVVITHNDSKFTYKIVRKLGADFIISKEKRDYSPRLVFDFAEMCHKSKPQEEHDSSDLDQIIAREVEKIGFTHAVNGTGYLIEAVTIAIFSGKTRPTLRKDIYPVIAKKFKKDIKCIEKAITGAIKRTWDMTDTETLQANYTSNINYNTGIPTNKEMIFFIVDKIKRDFARAS